MDPPPSSSRPSRRSYPNLHNLSLAPLSTKSLDASSPPSPSEVQATIPHTSYIQLKSAPSTPGILSLSQSRSNSRNGRRRSRGDAYAYDGYFVNPDAPVRHPGDIPKAKSTNALLPSVSFVDQQPHARHHRRKGTSPTPLRMPLVRHHTSEASEEWLHRAGLVIADEMRESKGQSWLVRRESSTSLVQQSDEYEVHPSHDGHHMALLSGEHLADDEYSPITPRHSRVGSRIGSRMGSRVASARNSRRGSRVGSRVDLIMSTSKSPNPRGSLEMDEGMLTDEAFIEPDFVDDGESDGDEEEIARLARERGFGLGGWMDRLIGWTLFSVDEDGEDSSDEEHDEDDPENPENMTREERKLRKEVEARRKKLEREAIIAASAAKTQETKESTEAKVEGEVVNAQALNEEGGGWQDAAWLLSVASKVIL
ncbi:uncharacterized protein BDR25DRAFT_305871 [Lindgomyces ingoldianus]|uniref:Uncharacterized protein n=1 Tax=Lindgomyces ingoldianus TaxID=673940 RepID=A0ACB6QJA3_9PLEO|nr:uncharacterized protein BDR25DRAFT_305871 [Lindgomyces ingoldianus]KAF2467089.1 hypothetical protein BDR25DRAFT_305871 [Lindgomyces ingoldianus]